MDEMKAIFGSTDTGDGIEHAGTMDAAKMAAIRAGFVRANMDTLPEKYRPVMQARYVDKLTTAETAKRLDMIPAQVQRLERDGLQWLRLKIELR